MDKGQSKLNKYKCYLKEVVKTKNAKQREERDGYFLIHKPDALGVPAYDLKLFLFLKEMDIISKLHSRGFVVNTLRWSSTRS